MTHFTHLSHPLIPDSGNHQSVFSVSMSLIFLLTSWESLWYIKTFIICTWNTFQTIYRWKLECKRRYRWTKIGPELITVEVGLVIGTWLYTILFLYIFEISCNKRVFENQGSVRQESDLIKILLLAQEQTHSSIKYRAQI